MYARVVVPLDGSEPAERALPHAVDFAVMAGTPLHLARVVDIAQFDPYGVRTPAVLDGLPELAAAETEANRYLAAIGERCTVHGAMVSIEARRGWVVDELVRMLHPNDLLVIATHGRSFVERALGGSVARSLLDRSPAPVVFINAHAS